MTTLHLHPRVSAGTGAWVFDERSRVSITLPRAICRQWLGFDPPDVMGVSEAVGDSMEPIIHDGDLVLYSLTPCVNGGGIYVVSYDGRILCKRLQMVGKSYRLIPENRIAGYEPELIRHTEEGWEHATTGDLIEFSVIGKVLWPNPMASRLHIQQAGELLRRMFHEAAND